MRYAQADMPSGNGVHRSIRGRVARVRASPGGRADEGGGHPLVDLGRRGRVGQGVRRCVQQGRRPMDRLGRGRRRGGARRRRQPHRRRQPAHHDAVQHRQTARRAGQQRLPGQPRRAGKGAGLEGRAAESHRRGVDPQRPLLRAAGQHPWPELAVLQHQAAGRCRGHGTEVLAGRDRGGQEVAGGGQDRARAWRPVMAGPPPVRRGPGRRRWLRPLHGGLWTRSAGCDP